MIGKRGVHYGRDFENLVSFQARLEGLLFVGHGSQVKRLSETKMIAVKSDLDARICHPDGRIVFVDMKSFDAAWATPSQWTRHQLQKVALYSKFGQRSGMLVNLRKSNQVVFFDSIILSSSVKRFDSTNGILLGTGACFKLSTLFALG